MKTMIEIVGVKMRNPVAGSDPPRRRWTVNGKVNRRRVQLNVEARTLREALSAFKAAVEGGER